MQQAVRYISVKISFTSCCDQQKNIAGYMNEVVQIYGHVFRKSCRQVHQNEMFTVSGTLQKQVHMKQNSCKIHYSIQNGNYMRKCHVELQTLCFRLPAINPILLCWLTSNNWKAEATENCRSLTATCQWAKRSRAFLRSQAS